MSAEILRTLQSGPGGISSQAGVDASGTPEAVRMRHIPDTLAILPIRGFVIFPGTVAPLNVRRPVSIRLLDETLPQSKVIGLVAQRDENNEEPGAQDLYTVGTAALVLKLLRQGDDHVIALVQGLRRFSLRKIIATDPFIRAEVTVLESVRPMESKEWQATFRNLRDSAARLLDLTPDAPDQSSALLRSIDNPEQLVDFVAPNLNIDVAQKQSILEELDLEKRLRAVQTHISSQLEIAQIQEKLQKDVQSQFSDAQRRAYLREQMKVIQRELGEGDTGTDQQIAQLRTRLENAKPPAEIMAAAERELKRLDFIPPASPEYSVIVTYVETIADLPWSKLSEDNLDLDAAKAILDRDHFDLEKVKRRLIEFLAVRKLNPA